MPIVESSVVHSSHEVPDEIIAGIRQIREAEVETVARQEQIARLARPNADERREITEIRRSTALSHGLNADVLQRLRDIRSRVSLRVRDELEQHIAIRRLVDFARLDLEAAQPPATDPSFWWARTDWWHTNRQGPAPDEGSWANFSADLRDDGLHFFSGVTTHDGDLYFDNFGAVALFELQANRIPRSPSGVYRSTPHVELFGRLTAYTGDDDIFTGDLWSKCWIHRDQQLFQWGFGPEGPAAIMLGQAHEVEALVFEENGERSVHVGLPGFKWMPPVTFRGVNTASSLWARVEVRFDIQTEGAGSLLWLDPEVVLRTFQWPLTPV